MPTILGNMEPIAPVRSTSVVTAPAAQFLGSFAADSRYDNRKWSAKQDVKSIVQHYFTEGWNDISIWKSAVSVNFLSECKTPVPDVDDARWFKNASPLEGEPHRLKNVNRSFIETNFPHQSLLSL